MKLLAIDFGQLKGIGPLGFEKSSPTWAVFTIITGAISIISSGGDKQALEGARKKITTGIIGLIIVLVALLIIEVVGYFLGFNGILNIQHLFCLASGATTCP